MDQGEEEKPKIWKRIKPNKQKILEWLYLFLTFLLFISAVISLQIVQTITVSEYGDDYQSYLCYKSNPTWIVRVLTFGITILFYDFCLSNLRKGCRKIKRGALKIKIGLALLQFIYILLMFVCRDQYLIGFITTNLYAIHLCQLHSIIYNKLHWLFQGVLNYLFVILTIPSSYLCFSYSSGTQQKGLIIGIIFAYIIAFAIMVILQFKTNLLNSINLIQEEDEMNLQLLQIQEQEKTVTREQKQFQMTMIIYTLLFQFISIYLNTNTAAIEFTFVQGGSSFYTQIFTYFFTLILYYWIIKLITLEDSINFLIIINCIFLGIDIINEGDILFDEFFTINFSIIVGGLSQLMPQLISHLYKEFFGIFGEDYYVRLGLGFNFISFFFQNYQFKRIWNFSAYEFEIYSSGNRRYSADYYQVYFPSIQIGFNLMSIPFFYISVWFYNTQNRKYRASLKKEDRQSYNSQTLQQNYNTINK